MKTFKDLRKSSSCVFAFIPTDIPSVEYAPLVEQLRSFQQNNLTESSIVFVNGENSKVTAKWMGVLFEGVEFQPTGCQSYLDCIDYLETKYNNIYVVDSHTKKGLYENLDVTFVACNEVYPGVQLNESEVSIAVETKNYPLFEALFSDYLSPTETRKLFVDVSPTKKYDDVVSNISEQRNAFYLGETFKIGSTVSEHKSLFEIVDRGSNYVMVVNESGELKRKFTSTLTETNKKIKFKEGELSFKGFVPSQLFLENAEVSSAFRQTLDAYKTGTITDAVAVLKSMRAVDAMLNEEKVDLAQIKFSLQKIGQLDQHRYLQEAVDKDAQLQAAKIIANAFGSSSSGNSPESIVNLAIKAAKKKSSSTQMKILKDMLDLASSVGVKYDKTLLESLDYRELHTNMKVLKEKPTKDVLQAHKDLHKLGMNYEARDVGGKRGMIADILSNNHGPRALQSYKSLSSSVRKSMDESDKYTHMVHASGNLKSSGFNMRLKTADGKFHKETDKGAFFKFQSKSDANLFSSGMKNYAKDVYTDAPQELNELSLDTVKSYSDKARTASVAHKKDPLKAALNRFKGQSRVQDRVHSHEMKQIRAKYGIKESVSSVSGPGKGQPFKALSTEDHLASIEHHHKEYNDLLNGSHPHTKALMATGRLEDAMKKSAKLYHAHKKAIQKNESIDEVTSYGRGRSDEHEFGRSGNQLPTKTKYYVVNKETGSVHSKHDDSVSAVKARNKVGDHMTYSIEKKSVNEVHEDPDYKEEIEVFGYEGLKKKLAQATGVANYGEKEPGKPINYVSTTGVDLGNSHPHSRTGFSLGHSNETHRRQLVKKLTDG